MNNRMALLTKPIPVFDLDIKLATERWWIHDMIAMITAATVESNTGLRSIAKKGGSDSDCWSTELLCCFQLREFLFEIVIAWTIVGP